MKMDDKQLDDLFRSKLDGFELKPPASVWEGIQAKQAEDRRRKKVFWLRISSAAAVLLLAFLLGYELQHQKSTAPFSGESIATNRHPESPESFSNQTNQTGSPEGGSRTGGTAIAETPAMKPEVGTRPAQPFRSKQAIRPAESTEQPAVGATVRPEAAQMTTLERIANRIAGGQNGARLAKKSQPESLLSEQDRLIIAQNTARMGLDKPATHPKSWEVSALVNPALSVNNSSHSAQYSARMNQATDNASMRLGGGLTVAMKTGSRWSVQSGILYNRLGQGSTNSISGYSAATSSSATGETYFVSGTSESGSFVIKAPAGAIVLNELPQNARVVADFESVSASVDVLMTTTSFEQLFDYIEIPLMVRYQLVDRQFGVQLIGGLNTGVLVGNSAWVNDGNSHIRVGSTAGMHRMSYSSNLGVGLGYRISEKLQIRFEPQIRYYLESLSGNSEVNYRPYTFGFYSGISYSF